MALKMTYHNKDFPDGYEFTIAGLGVFENGKEREVFIEQEEAFEASHSITITDKEGNTTTEHVKLKDAFADSNLVKLSGTARKTPEEETTEVEKEKGGES